MCRQPFTLYSHANTTQTKGLSLEEVNRVFGDKVAMEMSDITDDIAEKENVTVKHVDDKQVDDSV